MSIATQCQRYGMANDLDEQLAIACDGIVQRLHGCELNSESGWFQPEPSTGVSTLVVRVDKKNTRRETYRDGRDTEARIMLVVCIQWMLA